MIALSHKYCRIKYLFIAIAVAAATACPGIASAAVGNTTFTAKLDSMVILMGKQTKLRYQVVQDKDISGIFPVENPMLLAPNVEIYGEPTNDTTDLGSNRIQIDRTMIVQSFDSGLWEVPAAKYIIGKDTVFSNPLTLKVIPVDVDSLATIHDFKPVEGVPFNLLDFIPDFIYNYWWLWLLVIALIAGGYYLYTHRGKKIAETKEKEKPLLPPYEEAIEALNTLKADKLWQAGMEKEYFTRLTDILRRYIERRFGINAVEMTTTQIIDTLKRNEETRLVNQQLKQILDVADFVKFANMRPLPDDNEAAWNRAEKFVMDTRPAPEPETDNSAASDPSENSISTPTGK